MDNWACGTRQGSPTSIEARDAAEAPQPQLLHLRPHATHEPWPRSPHALLFRFSFVNINIKYATLHATNMSPKQCTRSR